MKAKLFLLGVFFVGIVFLVFLLFQKNFEAVQTSLIKYLDGNNHQCVAYVERYYQNMFGININNVGRAMLLPEKASKYGLFFHKNGSSVIPQPGDILVFSNKNKIGHVAIITGTLKKGVLIVEQNWKPNKITNNKGKALPAIYENGKYTIKDRYYSKRNKNKFLVIGWVSRNKSNPKTFFDFTNNNYKGWLLEHDVANIKNNNKKIWAMKLTGKDPRILSPVFLDGLSINDYKKITFRAKVENNKNATEGVLYLRDAKEQWSTQIPFKVDYSNEEYKEFSIDLSSLNSNFEITQIKLKLANNNYYRHKEIWKLDWLKIEK